MNDENFKITLQILQVLSPKFHSNSVSAVHEHCEGWIQCIASDALQTAKSPLQKCWPGQLGDGGYQNYGVNLLISSSLSGFKNACCVFCDKSFCESQCAVHQELLHISWIVLSGINPCVAINNQDDDRHGSLEKAQKTMSNFICVEAANEELDWSCT